MDRRQRITGLSLQHRILLVMFLKMVVTGLLGVHAETHYMEFTLEERPFTRLCSNKSMLVVNGMFPGPTVRVRKGDTLYVNTINNGTYGVTLHWHGVLQPRNPWSDGPEYITQCPIQPGANFTYEVIFSTEEGTLFWHAHSDWTRATVHGAIVIHPSEGTTYPFPEPDGERILVLGSWYTDDIKETIDLELEEGGDLLTSDAYTINGQPGDFFPCSKESTYRWHVDYWKTYLLRFVNADMNAELFLAIAGHNLTIVGMDAAYVKPFNTSYIMISPGHTVDALLIADQTPSHYYTLARQFISGSPGFTGFDFTNASAILEYNGNYTSPEKPEYPSIPYYYDLDAAIDFTVKLRSLADQDHPTDVPLNITTRMYITVSVNEFVATETTSLRMSSSMNNMSWVNPSIDVLTAYYRNLSGFYTTDFPDWPLTFFNFTETDLAGDDSTNRGTRLKVLDYGEEVEIVFQGTNVANASIAHPMHLHGYSFYVVGQGQRIFDPENDPKLYNLVDPPLLNTVSNPKNGWVAIRFKANNPGVWLLHCHLDRHLSWGMNTVLIVKNGMTPETSIREPPSSMPSCTVASNLEGVATDYNSLEG